VQVNLWPVRSAAMSDSQTAGFQPIKYKNPA
jgi:hypothetical protein